MNKKYISLFILTIGLINPVFADRGGGGDFHSGGGGFHDNEFHAGGGGFHGGDRLYSGNRVYAGDRFYGGDRVYGGNRFYGGDEGWGGYDRGWGGFGGWGGGGFWDGIVGGLAGTWLIGSLFNGWGNNNYNNGVVLVAVQLIIIMTVIQIKTQTLTIKMIHMVNNQRIIQQLSKMVAQILDIGYLA